MRNSKLEIQQELAAAVTILLKHPSWSPEAGPLGKVFKSNLEKFSIFQIMDKISNYKNNDLRNTHTPKK